MHSGSRSIRQLSLTTEYFVLLRADSCALGRSRDTWQCHNLYPTRGDIANWISRIPNENDGAKPNIVEIIVTPHLSAAGKFKLPGPHATLVLCISGDSREKVTSSLVVCLFNTSFLRNVDTLFSITDGTTKYSQLCLGHLIQMTSQLGRKQIVFCNVCEIFVI